MNISAYNCSFVYNSDLAYKSKSILGKSTFGNNVPLRSKNAFGSNLLFGGKIAFGSKVPFGGNYLFVYNLFYYDPSCHDFSFYV